MRGRIASWLQRAIPVARLGRMGEARAVWYLRLRGYRILARNVRSARGEIDVVVRRGSRVAFVEVKTRQQEAKGRGVDAVDRHKQVRIGRLADRHLRTMRLSPEDHVHFDVVSVFWTGWWFRIEHLCDAFVLEGEPGRPWRTQ